MILKTMAQAMTAALLLTWVGAARAEGEDRDWGVIVMINNKDIVFDKGTEHGVAKGGRLKLYRKVIVHHPLTGEKIEDRFFIGDARVHEAGELLSIVKMAKGFTEKPRVGDLVEILTPKKKDAKKTAPTEPGQPAESKQPAPTKTIDEEVVALLSAFNEASGKSLEVRQKLYFQFLLKYPKGRYAQAVGREIAWLSAQSEKMERAEAGLGDTAGPGFAEDAEKPEVVRVQTFHVPYHRLNVGDEASIVIAAVPPEAVSSAVLFIRKPREKSYKAVDMIRTGEFYFRAKIPEALLAEPGRFLYFVEVLDEEEQTITQIGNDVVPKVVVVNRPYEELERTEGRSVATASFEIVDFDSRKDVDDHYISFEADIFYRTFLPALYGLRFGVGIFDSVGGKIEGDDDGIPDPKELAALYGYLELEFEIVKIFHLMIRGLAGNHHTSELGTAVGVLGLTGGLRIGDEKATNLVLSGAIFQDVGYQGRLAFTIGAFEKIPIMVEGIVTDYPVDTSDLGLRLVLGTGYRFTDWLAVLARGSWNARTINHTGFGGGATVALSW